jgi:membrane protein YqaA with SNARE-associated domain
VNIGVTLAAALWGFAEATLFFIVPDVLLTFVTLRRGLRRALAACAWAAAGAVVGGAAIYAWAATDPDAALAAVGAVPAISADLMESVRQDLAAEGPGALFTAGVTGVPYKIYAAAAPGEGLHWAGFLAVSFAARMFRFALAVLATGGLDRLLSRRVPKRGRLALLAGVWLVFYAGYFSLMPD